VSARELGAALGAGGLVGSGLLLLALARARIVGVSGVVRGLLPPRAGDVGWRLAFVAGLVAGGALLAGLAPPAPLAVPRSLPALALGGFLVGYGASLANGCTSGHGVCGLARLRPRSLVATGIFVAAGALTVFTLGQLEGGRP
jgi:uncharacterized protein